jgi:hypothetical protein
MKTMAFCGVRFDQASIPAELRDIAKWPGADDSALSRVARNLLSKRVQAMALFVDGHTSLRAISRLTRLKFNDLYRLFERCVTMDEDGRIFGMRALVPYMHTRAYRRSAAVLIFHAEAKGGASGLSPSSHSAI